jgi:acetolactate synthase-1/2/3 large subunit
MGIALPGGIAAALAPPQQAVVAAMGDGGFLMNAQELETAKRLGIGFTVIVFNDNDYGLISWKQTVSRGRAVGTRLSNPNFRVFAESFGIRAYQPRNALELRDALTESIESRKLRLIEVAVDSRVNLGLVEKLDRYWRNRTEIESGDLKIDDESKEAAWVPLSSAVELPLAESQRRRLKDVMEYQKNRRTFLR